MLMLLGGYYKMNMWSVTFIYPNLGKVNYSAMVGGSNCGVGILFNIGVYPLNTLKSKIEGYRQLFQHFYDDAVLLHKQGTKILNNREYPVDFSEIPGGGATDDAKNCYHRVTLVNNKCFVFQKQLEVKYICADLNTQEGGIHIFSDKSKLLLTDKIRTNLGSYVTSVFAESMGLVECGPQVVNKNSGNRIHTWVWYLDPPLTNIRKPLNIFK